MTGPIREEWVADRRYVVFDRFAQLPSLVHAYSTKPHDMSLREKPDANRCAANRAQFLRDLNLAPETACYACQVHGTALGVIENEQQAGNVPDVDGLLTERVHQPLVTFSADCPLILVYDSERHALGMVHASWRCTVAHAAAKLIQQMGRCFGCCPADLLAGIGPSIGPRVYEVGADVRQAASEHLDGSDRFFTPHGAKFLFDLWAANTAQLLAAGLDRENILIAGVCTVEDNDRFYSYRHENTAGRFALAAALLPR